MSVMKIDHHQAIIKKLEDFFSLLSIFLFMVLLISLFMIFPSQAGTVKNETGRVSSKGREFSHYNDYHSLIVGVSNYDKWPDLPNSVKDAKEVSWFLKRMGFKVTLLIDPGSQELKDALDHLTQVTGKEADRGIIFYYSGHGKTQTLTDGTKLGWIIPRDCPLWRDDPQGFSGPAINMKEIEKYSSKILSKYVLMLFDSSFSDNIFSIESAELESIDENTSMPVRQYIIAGRENEPVPEKSIFKRFLLKGLKGDADLIYDGYITGSELGVYLLNIVEKASGGSLHPQYGKINNPDMARGDFVLLLKETKLKVGRLFIETGPKNALISILNIKPKFTQGIELKPGRYNIKVSAEGYATAREWISLEAEEDKTVTIQLNKIANSFINNLGMKFVRIPSGSFTMGSAQNEHGGLEDEKAHRVTLTKDFYMQTTEVTVEQFGKFIKATKYKTEAEKKGGCWVCNEQGLWKQTQGSKWNNPGSRGIEKSFPADNLPVTCISWDDVQSFIRWLNRKEGKTYGLPTEAEWEYACRAQTTTPFSFGTCLSTSQENFGRVGAIFSDCQSQYHVNRKTPVEAGSLAPNPWGLFDMHGNVSEWCQDWHGPYPHKPVKDPKGPSSGMARAMRGGHWLSEARDCRSAKRGSFQPGVSSDVIGFRLVLRP